jgi:hypothetical protein
VEGRDGGEGRRGGKEVRTIQYDSMVYYSVVGCGRVRSRDRSPGTCSDKENTARMP